MNDFEKAGADLGGLLNPLIGGTTTTTTTPAASSTSSTVIVLIVVVAVIALIGLMVMKPKAKA